MIETMEQLLRRDKAVKIAAEIMRHPAYPFAADDFPRAMVTILERGLKEWATNS